MGARSEAHRHRQSSCSSGAPATSASTAASSRCAHMDMEAARRRGHASRGARSLGRVRLRVRATVGVRVS